MGGHGARAERDGGAHIGHMQRGYGDLGLRHCNVDDNSGRDAGERGVEPGYGGDAVGASSFNRSDGARSLASCRMDEEV